MKQSTLCNVWIFFFIYIAVANCFSETTPFVIDKHSIDSDKPVYFEGWKYHVGDNPAWADPNFDDRDWETADSLLSQNNLPSSGWNGIGWFRFRFITDSSIESKSVVLLISQWGSSEIYLNGKNIRTYGKVGQSKDAEVHYVMYFHRSPQGYARVPNAFPVEISPNTESVIAVRYSNHRHESLFAISQIAGFEIGIQTFDSW